MRKILAALAMFILSGCFLDSGTWNNDENNWERIFGGEKPENIVVKNSRFWKSSHWTYEYCYFLEIKNDPKFISKIIVANHLSKVLSEKAKINFFEDKPEWFLPKDINEYKIWQKEGDFENMKLFIDKKDGTIFLTDFQV